MGGHDVKALKLLDEWKSRGVLWARSEASNLQCFMSHLDALSLAYDRGEGRLRGYSKDTEIHFNAIVMAYPQAVKRSARFYLMR